MTNFEIALIVIAILAAFAGYFYGLVTGVDKAAEQWEKREQEAYEDYERRLTDIEMDGRKDEALWWRKNSYGLIEPEDRSHD